MLYPINQIKYLIPKLKKIDKFEKIYLTKYHYQNLPSRNKLKKTLIQINMANPFKKITNNANTTKKVYGTERTHSKTKTRKCEGCGAARPSDTNLTTCDYCGFKFMPIEGEINVDKKEDL